MNKSHSVFGSKLMRNIPSVNSISQARGGDNSNSLKKSKKNHRKEKLHIMKRIILLISVIMAVVFVITLSVGSSTAEAAEKVYRMKIQSAYPRGDLSMELLKEFAKSADKRSKGRIKIQVFADPELVPAEQLFESAQKGTLDMIHAVAALHVEQSGRKNRQRKFGDRTQFLL
jgi:hypothetical protein